MEDIAATTHDVKVLHDKVQLMESTHHNLVLKLDDQIDRNMRETLVINGVDGNEKTWDETKTILCDLLNELDDNGKFSKVDYQRNIVRAHRGEKNNRKDGLNFCKVY